MPDNYEQSIDILHKYFTTSDFDMVLNSSNSTTANKIILDCLIVKINYREELLDLCDKLETIATSAQSLMMAITELRSGK